MPSCRSRVGQLVPPDLAAGEEHRPADAGRQHRCCQRAPRRPTRPTRSSDARCTGRPSGAERLRSVPGPPLQTAGMSLCRRWVRPPTSAVALGEGRGRTGGGEGDGFEVAAGRAAPGPPAPSPAAARTSAAGVPRPPPAGAAGPVGQPGKRPGRRRHHHGAAHQGSETAGATPRPHLGEDLGGTFVQQPLGERLAQSAPPPRRSRPARCSSPSTIRSPPSDDDAPAQPERRRRPPRQLGVAPRPAPGSRPRAAGESPLRRHGERGRLVVHGGSDRRGRRGVVRSAR